MQKVSASVVNGTLEREEVYRTKFFDSLCSLCLVFWARPLYSSEYKNSREEEEGYKAKIFHGFIKVETIHYQNHQNNQKKKNHSNSLISLICLTNYFFLNVFTFFKNTWG